MSTSAVERHNDVFKSKMLDYVKRIDYEPFLHLLRDVERASAVEIGKKRSAEPFTPVAFRGTETERLKRIDKTREFVGSVFSSPEASAISSSVADHLTSFIYAALDVKSSEDATRQSLKTLFEKARKASAVEILGGEAFFAVQSLTNLPLIILWANSFADSVHSISGDAAEFFKSAYHNTKYPTELRRYSEEGFFSLKSLIELAEVSTAFGTSQLKRGLLFISDTAGNDKEVEIEKVVPHIVDSFLETVGSFAYSEALSHRADFELFDFLYAAPRPDILPSDIGAARPVDKYNLTTANGEKVNDFFL